MANSKQTFQQTKDQAENAASDTKEQVKNLASDAKEQVKSLASDAKDQAKDIASQANDHVQNLIGQQKEQTADRLGSLARALRDAGHKLNDDQKAGDFGQYADRAAQQVERLSNYLRDSDLRGIVHDTESFARRRPEVFLGGTLIAGLMLARFLKASSPSPNTGSGYQGGARAGVPQSSRGSNSRPAGSGAASNPRPAQPTSYNSPAGV